MYKYSIIQPTKMIKWEVGFAISSTFYEEPKDIVNKKIMIYLFFYILHIKLYKKGNSLGRGHNWKAIKHFQYYILEFLRILT